MTDGKVRSDFFVWILSGFAAGFPATLIFHQLTLAVLWHAGLAPFPPFPMVASRRQR